ncbi:hypothetical protein AQUCO_03900082v1 [Aquilegia coerulea]|uniref:Receptor-like serine/threonine-protein kinase n=1 Tax=Aquilegia coerulea TaxID=218851 RepID=A0A2G5CRM1_AQUCA|nr:hypothetical protein AQUCO_03900082v1 [Aquilegia coerulea]
MSLSLYFPLLHLILLIFSSYSINAQSSGDTIANVSTSWINNPSSCTEVKFFGGGSLVRLIYSHPVDNQYTPYFAFAFYCNGNCNYFQLAILFNYTSTRLELPEIIWSANRNKLVRENSTLEFTREGDLILKDVNGSFVWSTNTSGRSVTGLKFTDFGNLVLIDKNNSFVWQSYDHPTNTLFLGQKLVEGQKLVASVSEFNWTEGLYSLSVTANGLFAFFASDPPLSYSETKISGPKTSKEPSYAKFLNGSFALYILNAEPNKPDRVISVPASSSVQYVRLDPDGHLYVYDFGDILSVHNLLTTSYGGDCGYPLVCGNYSICSPHYEYCTCPPVTEDGVGYFRPVDNHNRRLVCYEITPLSCEDPQSHLLLDLHDITFFNLGNGTNRTDYDSCRLACLSDCSCKVAFFRHPKNEVEGNCFIQSDVFSLVNYSDTKNSSRYNVHAFIKVQTLLTGPEPSPSSQPIGITDDVPKAKDNVTPRSSTFILVASLAALLTLIIVTYVAVKKNNVIEEDEICLDDLQGIPSQFSYEDLKAATGNFRRKLGQGAFGTVYEGVLTNGVKVAVKRLNGLGNMKTSFLTEVQIIGGIHHMNLVRLLGFCADKSHRLLVYEIMGNGSLDKWIFGRKKGETLDWKTRKKIILDIAKGLTYLHEDCQNRILHLDIKPQNILLDNKFNAKVSDFGLSKLINREESRIMTIMRGTPGYMAPEWLNSMITEKVDVFSFGVVVLEMLCGRKSLDFTQPEEYIQLLRLLEKKAKEDRFHDMIDKNCEDMQLHREEVVEMMKVSEWCLQSEYSERPSMSVVVKVLEGLMDLKPNLNYNFSSTLPFSTTTEGLAVSPPLLPSILSGPR